LRKANKVKAGIKDLGREWVEERMVPNIRRSYRASFRNNELVHKSVEIYRSNS